MKVIYKIFLFLLLLSLVGRLLWLECQGNTIAFNGVSLNKFYYYNGNNVSINQVIERHFALIALNKSEKKKKGRYKDLKSKKKK